MAAVRKILLNYNLKREICSATVNYAKNLFRESRVMRKILKNDVGKRTWYESKPRMPVGPMETPKLTSNHVTRRRTVLNKLFMQHITDLMATGEASTDLLGRNIEITHVNVTPDFQTVLVYWASKKDSKYRETEEILNKCAYSIRHELTQLRVIGQVPLIKFVKNKQIAFLAELDKRLSLADYGEDYEPTIVEPVRKSELSLNVKLPPEVKEKILQLEEDIEEETEEDCHMDVPPMRHDVLGLDHYAIMTRVKISLNKSHEAAKNRLLNIASEAPLEPNISTAIQGFMTAKEDSAAFTDFLRMRQIEERRKLRRENKETVLEYNNRTVDMLEDDDDVFTNIDEKDIDEFEDIDLESLK